MHAPIITNTVGNLQANRHTLFGWCRRCASRYRMAARPEENPPASFAIDVAALIAQRGPDAPVVRMAPVPCPHCGSRDTEARILDPPLQRG